MSLEALWNCLAAVCTMLTGVSFLALLIDGWRRPRRHSLLILLTAAALIAAFQVACFHLLDLDTANFFTTLADLGSLVLTLVLARWNRGRLLFSIAAAYSFTFSTVFISYLFSARVGPVQLAARVVLAGIFCVILLRWFAPCLRSAFRIDISGWYGLSLLPITFGLLSFTVTAGKFSAVGSSTNFAPYFPGISIVTGSFVLLILPICTYVVLYQFFRSLNRHYAAFREREALSAGVAALEYQQKNAQRLWERNAAFLTELEQELALVKAAVSSGDLSGALVLTEGLEGEVFQVMNAKHARHYTDEPLSDAVLRDYAAMAENEGIDLSISFSLPQELELDNAALAVVLSNALENAMNACRAQPEGAPRCISLSTNNTPVQFFLQLENSCARPVEFDHVDGYPVSRREGHGYGTRSIASFVRQNHGMLRYEWHDGVFSLKLLL